ncbi:MAG: hypothetical protein F6J90_12445 [Moorea sp. SIOASIH]|nr:hypothetical protein [Moorena sp. SIOASIH]
MIPTPVPLLGGVRGGFRLPFPSWEGLGVGSDSRLPAPYSRLPTPYSLLLCRTTIN